MQNRKYREKIGISFSGILIILIEETANGEKGSPVNMTQINHCGM
jgi:hypothetical protein